MNLKMIYEDEEELSLVTLNKFTYNKLILNKILCIIFILFMSKYLSSSVVCIRFPTLLVSL
jgi:hypothetical protein